MSKSNITVDDLIQQLHGSEWVLRCDAARQLQDPDETVHVCASWAISALQKVISYRNQFGM
jgi:hypothetical protein